MSLLIDGLPYEVEINGDFVKLKTDFRTGILFDELINDGSIDDDEKLITALALFYDDRIILENLQEAVDAIMWFYRCGKQKNDYSTNGDVEHSESKVYSFEHDSEYIYAAFLQSYGIDLAKTNLHWWQFMALFKALPEDTQFMKIVGYRSLDNSALSKMSKEQKQHYKRMKKIYALPETEDKKQLETDLAQILMNGGNPSQFV